MEINSLDVPMPTDELDLRGASVNIEIQIAEMSGQIMNAVGDEGVMESNAFRLASTTFTIEAADLAGPIALRASTRATFKDADGGLFSLDLQADHLLNENGSYIGGLPELRGDVAVVGASSDLLQPFVDRFGIDLAETLGTNIDAKLEARATPSSTTNNSRDHATDLKFSLDTARLSAHGRVLVDANLISTTGEQIIVEIQSAGAVLGSLVRALAPSAETTFTGAGTARLSITGLALPLTGRSVSLDRASALVSFETGGFAIQPTAQGPTIDAESLGASFTLAPDQLSRAHLTGSARLVEFPTMMLASLARLTDEDADLLTQSLGATINTTVSALPSAQDGSITINVIAAGEQAFLAQANLRLTPSVEIRVVDSLLAVNVNPDLATRVTDRFAPDLVSPPQLASSARLSLAFKSFSIPLGADGMPDLQSMAPVQATMTINDNLLFTGIPIGGETTINTELRSVRVTALYDPAKSRNGRIEIQSQIFDPRTPGQLIGSLHADATLTDERIEAHVQVEQIDTHRLDALLGKPDLFELSIGSPATISLTTSRTSNADPIIVEIGVESPRLTTTALVHADSNSVTLVEPTTVQWTMDPRWASKYVSTSAPNGGESKLSISGPTTMNLSIRRASIGMGATPMKPGVFDLDVSVSIPSLLLTLPDGVVSKHRDISAQVSSRPTTGAVAFHATMTSEDRSLAPFNLTGQIAQLADASGALTPDRATVTFQADGDLPTAIIDALAQAGGRIAETLGPTVRIRAELDRFSREGGSLDVSASSSRASATVAGHAKGGSFYADEPVSITLTTVTPKLGKLVFQQLFPMIGTIEKNPPDAPATITAIGLVLPTNKDLTKLSGSLDINLGHVSYSASPFFSIILNATNNNPDTMMFADWPPLKITIVNGVARYDRVALPFGNLTFDTEGEVDLVHQRANIIVYVPLFALMDQVANVVVRVPGVTSDTLIPIRMKGPLGSLKAEPAIDLLPKELFKNPENLLKELFKNRLLPR